MSNLSQQFLFAIGTGTTTATSVSIPGNAISPDGGATFYSKPEKGDGYFGFGDGLHTVTYAVAPYFDGIISMQASLATQPTAGDWFDVANTSLTYSQLTNSTTTNYINFTGNFVWVRSRVIRLQNIPTTSVLAISYNH